MKQQTKKSFIKGTLVTESSQTHQTTKRRQKNKNPRVRRNCLCGFSGVCCLVLIFVLGSPWGASNIHREANRPKLHSSNVSWNRQLGQPQTFFRFPIAKLLPRELARGIDTDYLYYQFATHQTCVRLVDRPRTMVSNHVLISWLIKSFARAGQLEIIKPQRQLIYSVHWPVKS